MNALLPSKKLLRVILAAETILVILAALAASFFDRNILSSLFSSFIVLGTFFVLVAWSVGALVVRLILVGKVDRLRTKRRILIAWVLVRMGLFPAAGILLVSGLAAAVANLTHARMLIEAAFLLMMLITCTGLATGAGLNTMLVVRHRRRRTAL